MPTRPRPRSGERAALSLGAVVVVEEAERGARLGVIAGRRAGRLVVLTSAARRVRRAPSELRIVPGAAPIAPRPAPSALAELSRLELELDERARRVDLDAIWREARADGRPIEPNAEAEPLAAAALARALAGAPKRFERARPGWQAREASEEGAPDDEPALDPDIPTSFAPSLVRSASALARRAWEPEAWRDDLSALAAVTIDDASSRDLDDALSLTPRPGGGWELGIHIAEPGALIERGSAIEEVARRRATSIFLPGKVIPMLPGPIIDAASLEEGALRPALSLIIEVDERGELGEGRVRMSAVRVERRLTYAEVDAALDGGDVSIGPLALGALAKIARCAQARRARAPRPIELPRASIVLGQGADGRARLESLKVTTKKSAARAMIEELMIVAGARVAEFCRERAIPILYRAQRPPAAPDWEASVGAVPAGLARSFAMMRAMRPARIVVDAAPHFGLGLKAYTHATSPIRRYTDVIVQRQVRAHLRGAPMMTRGELAAMAGALEVAGRRAARAARWATRYWTLRWLESRRGTIERAVVVERLSEREAIVLIAAAAWSGRCKTSAPLGAEIGVAVSAIDLDRGRAKVRVS